MHDSRSRTAGGRIDLTDNDLVWDYDGASPIGSWGGSSYSGAIGLVQTGRGDGSWNGLSGITTSMTDATTGVFTTIAVADASNVLGLSEGQTMEFSGETIDDTTVVFKYTFGGDADLNGELNGDDYFFLDSNVTQSGSVISGKISATAEVRIDDGYQDNPGHPGTGTVLSLLSCTATGSGDGEL